MSDQKQKKEIDLASHEGGAIYVEFILSFIPLFVLFLGICQLSLITSARLVVGRAASSAARSAAVILEEDPELFGGVERGVLSGDEPSTEHDLSKVLDLLGQKGVGELAESASGPQQGARMKPIRNSAYLPLLAIAPTVMLKGDSLRSSVERDWTKFGFAADYVRGASAITLVSAPSGNTLVSEPVPRNALINVRVQFAFSCMVPLARRLMCRRLDATTNQSSSHPAEERNLLKESMSRFKRNQPADEANADPLGQFALPFAENSGFFSKAIVESQLFVMIEGNASMPNQGAAYYE